jgi:hypothetical protein
MRGYLAATISAGRVGFCKRFILLLLPLLVVLILVLLMGVVKLTPNVLEGGLNSRLQG